MSTKHQAICDGCGRTAEPVTSTATSFPGSTTPFPAGWTTLVVQQHTGPRQPFHFPPLGELSEDAYRQAVEASAATAPRTLDLCAGCSDQFRTFLASRHEEVRDAGGEVVGRVVRSGREH